MGVFTRPDRPRFPPEMPRLLELFGRYELDPHGSGNDGGALATRCIVPFYPDGFLADPSAVVAEDRVGFMTFGETYVKVNGTWRYVYRAVDQHGQVIDALVSPRRDAGAARRFFTRALRTLKVMPNEVVTDAAPVYPGVLDELLPQAWHHVEQYANNPVENDHGRLKHRLRSMRGLRTDTTAQVIIAGHAFVQNLCRGHYELAIDTLPAQGTARSAVTRRSRRWW